MNQVHALLEAEDYVAALHLHSRWTLRRLLMVVGFLVAGLVLILADGRRSWLFVVGCGLIGGAVGGTLAREFARHFVLPRKARRIFAQQANLQQPFELCWDEQALQVTSTLGNSRTPWTDYRNTAQDDRIIMLYHSDAMFQMVPMRSLTDSVLRESFLSCVRRIGAH